MAKAILNLLEKVVEETKGIILESVKPKGVIPKSFSSKELSKEYRT